MMYRAKAILLVIRAGFSIFLNWSATGRENVPAQGALIVVCNHVHLVDPLLLMCASPRWITYMAKEELFRYPVIGVILRWGGVLPVARGREIERKRDVMRQAEELLATGNALALFPEGRRDHTGVLINARPGAAILAAHTGATILPAAITGTEKLHGISWLWRRPAIRIVFGEPMQLSAVEGRIPRSTAAALGDEVMHRIAGLLPADRRGPYGS